MFSEYQNPMTNMDAIYEMRDVLFVVIDDLNKKINGIGIRLQTKIRDVVGVQQKERTAKMVIQLKKMLEKFPVDEEPFVSKLLNEEVDSTSPKQNKLAVFRKAMEFSLWEITSKLTLLKKFISHKDMTEDTTFLYQIGEVINQVKKVVQEMISMEQIYVNENNSILTSSQISRSLANISENEIKEEEVDRTKNIVEISRKETIEISENSKFQEKKESPQVMELKSKDLQIRNQTQIYLAQVLFGTELF